MPIPPPSGGYDLSASHTDRQRAARQEHDQWLKDHPDFSSREMLENWTRIREAWGLTTNRPRLTTAR